jgi:hypothetical protein
MQVVAGKLAIVEATEKHGNMPLLGISRLDDDATFRCDVPGAFWIDLQIDFRECESDDLGLIDISIAAPAGSAIRPTKHQELCGSHKHYHSTDGETGIDDRFAPRSFQQFIFVGVLARGDFHIAFDFENVVDPEPIIKADLQIRRYGTGLDYLAYEGRFSEE